MPTARSSAASAAANRAASATSPLRPSAAIGGHSVNGALQPRDAAAFLIDAHPERQLGRQRLHVVRQLGHLLGRLDVAREEDDAAERELARERSHLGSDGRAGQAADQQLTDVATDGAGTEHYRAPNRS